MERSQNLQNHTHPFGLRQSFQDLVVNDSYWDTVLVCGDGNLIHNKLTVGLLFPELLTVSVFSFPVQTTLLLPDHSVRELTQQLTALVGTRPDLTAHSQEIRTNTVNQQQCHTKDVDLMLLDSGAQTFICGFCDKSFSHLDQLVRHKKIHTSKISVDDFPDFDTATDDIDTEEVFETKTEKKEVPQPNAMLNLETSDFQNWNKPKMEVKQKVKSNGRLQTETFPEGINSFNGEILGEENEDFYMNENQTNCKVSPDCSFSRLEPLQSTQYNVQEFVEEQMKAFKEEKLATKGSRSARRTYTGELYPGDKPYKCTFCDKRFKQVGHVNLHERTHTGGQKYICPYCNKKFNQSSHLKDHERIHTGEKPFMCSDCGKCFGYNSALKSHKRIHTGEKLYKCSFCEKTFNQLGNLKTHERLHTGELKYMCSECGKCYNTRSNLSRHSCKSGVKQPVQQVQVHNLML